MRSTSRAAVTAAASFLLLLSGAVSMAIPAAAVELPSRPATAAEIAALAADDYHGCNGSEASNNSYVHVCFQPLGDVIFVYDDEPDGERAVGHLIARARNHPSGHFTCANADGYNVRWVACGKWADDVYENQTVYYYGTTRNGPGGQDHNETSRQFEYNG